MSTSVRTSGARKAKGQKSERTVEILLAAAQAVFVASGYERATTAEIALRAGVSEATVFAYFGSKRQLCLEVIRRWYGTISAELERDVPTFLGMRARLQFVIRKHLAHLMGDGIGLCALILGEGRTVDQVFSDAIVELKRRYTRPLVRALDEAQTDGELRSDVPVRLMRDMVYGAMEHVLWGYVASGHKPSLEETSRQLTEVFMAGFGSKAYQLKALQRFQADVKAAAQALEVSRRLPGEASL